MKHLLTTSDQELQDEVYRRQQARLDARTATDTEIQAIRKAYMDKYDGGPPSRPPYITFLESELVRVRLILREITSAPGADDDISALANAALNIAL